jgi:glyoxylase-like metal-dependent hydrolase (beta-lactamase superfamily II)
MLNKISAFLFIIACFSGSNAAAQTAEPQIRTEKINDNFYVFYGGNGQGANVGMSVGEDGILLIDAMVTASNQKLLAAIREISDKQVKFVINTHSDRDHSGGNQFFADKGATIIGQENAQYSEVMNHLQVSDRFTLNFNGERIVAKHVIAHSYNDLIIYFPENNIVFTGDTHTNTYHPYSQRFGLEGQLNAVELALNFADENSKIVPGHGFIDNRQGLLGYEKGVTAWTHRVEQLHAANKSVEEMIQDPGLIGMKNDFVKNRKPPELPDGRFRRFIERTISADFINNPELDGLNLKPYIGNYQIGENRNVELVLEDGRLLTRELGESIGHLIPLSKTSFHVRASLGRRYEFDIDASGHVDGFKVHSGDANEVTEVAKRRTHKP